MTTPIRQALIERSSLHPLVKDGIQALENAHRALIEEDIRSLFADSLDIDKAFLEGREQENRWDYLLGHKDSKKLFALEPHTASNGEISTVIKKREAALRHLRTHLRAGAFVTEWFWVASGKVDFVPMEKALNRLNQNGIRFVGKQLLRARLPNDPVIKGVVAKNLLGKPAPDFTLKDLAGTEIQLSKLRGKTVVLEWFNPSCPFVKRLHSTGSLVGTAKALSKSGVVWLAINSGSRGKQGSKAKENAAVAEAWSIEHPILLDESGIVGKTYGATHTPHMFVIDATGLVVYTGAIDNLPDPNKPPKTIINHVTVAVSELAKGERVRTSYSEVYGSSVRYG